MIIDRQLVIHCKSHAGAVSPRSAGSCCDQQLGKGQPGLWWQGAGGCWERPFRRCRLGRTRDLVPVLGRPGGMATFPWPSPAQRPGRPCLWTLRCPGSVRRSAAFRGAAAGPCENQAALPAPAKPEKRRGGAAGGGVCHTRREVLGHAHCPALMMTPAKCFRVGCPPQRSLLSAARSVALQEKRALLLAGVAKPGTA